MSSLDNQMMVPTLTRFGRLAGVRGTGSVTDAVATKVIITTPRRGCAADPRFSPLAVQDIVGTGTGVPPPKAWSRRPGPVRSRFLAIGPGRRDIRGYGGRPPGREQ